MKRSGVRMPVVVLVCAMLASVGFAQEGSAGKSVPLPEGPGLAAKYPGDVGIEKDPTVLFHDDFELGKPGSKWDQVTGGGYVEAETDPEIARSKQSARLVVKQGRNTNAGFWKRTPGQDELYMRCYVRYGNDFGYLHHGGSGFCASAREDSFGPGGHAGRAPKGDTYFWNTLEPIGRRERYKPPGALMFYAYWWKMKPDGRGNYWGNLFQPDPPQVPGLRKWTCIEWRVKVNSPGEPDGELDCWVNGIKCGEFREINWRSAESLKVNQVQLSLYLEWSNYRGSRREESRTVWYDDVVVATQYIGPTVPVAGEGPGAKAQ